MSRFVSANANADSTSEEDIRWLAAQAAIEATRSQPRLPPGQQEGGKSLFETLEANKGPSVNNTYQSPPPGLPSLSLSPSLLQN